MWSLGLVLSHRSLGKSGQAYGHFFFFSLMPLLWSWTGREDEGSFLGGPVLISFSSTVSLGTLLRHSACLRPVSIVLCSLG